MLRTSLLQMLLLLAAVAGVVTAADNPAVKPAAPGVTGKAANEQVIAYYFHGTVRCEMCLTMERLAREVIEQRFPVEVAEKCLVFKPLNFDKPENEHFLKDYKLPCPSLVLVRQKAGKDKNWKLLDKTWTLIENPGEFNAYVEREAGKFLKGTK